MRWIVIQSFEVNSQPLNIDIIEAEMSFDDVINIINEVAIAEMTA